jgi:3-methyladenine DNA glycosylase Tag
MAQSIVLKDVAHLEETFIRLLHNTIITRKRQKKWQAEFGAENKRKMQEAEARLDEFIENLIIKYTSHRNPKELQIHYTKIKL